ncbi:MAG: hypothetical protein U0599_18445 [Vicinamibacteria bacterium]
MSGETVLVSTTGLDGGLRGEIAEACAHARVLPVFCSPGGGDGTPRPANPALLIAPLPAGQRAVPEDVAALASLEYQAAPLLLLCAEPLVRHSVTLQGGRVTLLGSPLTREKIGARIRTAIATAEGAASLRSGRVLQVREMQGREWWAGGVSRDAAVVPLLSKLGRQGVAGFVSVDGERPIPESAAQNAAWMLTSGLPVDRAAASLVGALGPDAVAVWFSPAAGQWALHVPSAEVDVWLHSPLRLPGAWRFGPREGERGAHLLAASGGDLVVAATGAARSAVANGARVQLAQAAEAGGPALVDHLESILSNAGGAGAALVVELR